MTKRKLFDNFLANEPSMSDDEFSIEIENLAANLGIKTSDAEDLVNLSILFHFNNQIFNNHLKKCEGKLSKWLK